MELCKTSLVDGIYKATWFLYDLTIEGLTYKTQFGEFHLGQAFNVRVKSGCVYRINN